MRGERSGAVKKIGDVCLNLVSVPGCSVHLANLIAKDVCTANPCLSEVIEFISSLSSLLQTTPKAQSMLSQVEEYLKLPGLPSFSSTRFLCLFTLVSGILLSFPKGVTIRSFSMRTGKLRSSKSRSQSCYTPVQILPCSKR